MTGSFDVPFGHLAFDDSGVGTVSSYRVESLHDERDGVEPAAVTGPRGKKRALR